jgi:ADP-ribose pyrophosphatase YjhB (NUDIX family)
MVVSLLALAVLLAAVAVLGYIWHLERPKGDAACPTGWRFCPLCSKPLVMGPVDGKQRLHCSCCKFVHWDNPKPVAVVLIPSGNGLVLVRRAVNPRAGMLALPGGFVEPFEDIEAGARREAREETGLEVEIERLLCILTPPGVNEHLHFFLARSVEQQPAASDDAAEAFVVARDAVPFESIAFETHVRVIKEWLGQAQV